MGFADSTRLIERLLAETPESAAAREKTALGTWLGAADAPIVLQGAGTLGRKVLGALRRNGHRVVAVADSDPSRWNTSYESIPVVSPESAARQFGREALFIVSIFRGQGDEGMEARILHLRSLGCERVISFLPVAWAYPDGFLPHFAVDRPSRLLDAAGSLGALASLWADDASSATFAGQLAWRLQGEFAGAVRTEETQYFPSSVYTLGRSEALFDGGAFDGDTLRSAGDSVGRAWAVEPDPKNAAALKKTAGKHVEVFQAALAGRQGRALFQSDGSVASALSTSGGETVIVDTIDRIAGSECPTILKLDIEGAELDALYGARRMLKRCAPVCAICVYHRPSHFWEIPLFLREELPDHALYLRAHQNDGFELVVYAVPAGRRSAP